MRITIITVGRKSNPQIQALIATYEKRLSGTITMIWDVLSPSLGSGQQARNEESATIMSRIKENDSVILLDERGVEYTNQVFARHFVNLASSQGRCVFIIGGAFGVNDILRQRAQLVWSLSTLVFPHQLVRVMLAEQIYRTYAITQGHPYHHE